VNPEDQQHEALEAPPPPPPPLPEPAVAETAVPEIPSDSFQPLSIADGQGAALIVASVVVYAFMEIIGKPLIKTLAASRAKSREERERLVLMSVFIPGCLVAMAIDPTPLLAFLHVTLPWWATVPIGGLAYGGGGVFVHNVMKTIKPAQALKQVLYKRFGIDDASIDAKARRATQDISLSQSQALDLAKARRDRDDSSGTKES